MCTPSAHDGRRNGALRQFSWCPSYHARSPVILFILLSVSLPPERTSAQQPTAAFGRYRLDVWRAQDGVRLAFTSNMVESHEGYLWLSSESGVTRFDGARFVVFDGTNTPALAGRPRLQTVPLLEDHDGTLWVGSDIGMLAYSAGVFRPAAIDTSFTTDQINAALVDPRGTIWAVTRSGRVVRVPRGGRPVDVQGTTVSYSGSNLTVDASGDVWIAAGRDAVYRVHNDTLIRVQFPADVLVDDPNRVFASSDSSIWFGTRTALVQLRHGRFRRIPLPSRRALNAMSSIAEAADGALWIGTHGAGLYRFDGETFTAFTSNDGLSDDRVIEILRDRNGNMWVATRDGLNRFRPVPFDAFTVRTGLPTSMPGGMVRDESGTMWLAPPTGGLYRGRIADGRASFVEVESPQNYDRVTVLTPARGGGVWSGHLLGSVSRFVAGASAAVTLATGLPPVTDVHEDADGTVWIGTWRGLFRMHAGELSTIDRQQGLADVFVHRILRDSAGTLWVATQTGIARATVHDGSRFVVHAMPDGSANRAIVLFEAPRGMVWLGSAEGLARVSGGRPAFVSTAQGLPETWVGSGDEDGLGNLWLGQLAGMTRVSLADLIAVTDGRVQVLETVQTYEALDGLPGGDPGAWPHPWTFRDDDGNLWVAMGHGVVMIDPREAAQDLTPPAMHLEDIIVDGVQFSTSPSITLSPGVRRFELRYAGVDLSNGPGVRFRHRLEPFDTTWIDAGTQRHAAYTRLAPGRYTFRVTGRTGSGAWTPTEASLDLLILAPFYRRAWFIAVVSLMLGLAGYSLLRTRSQRAAERIRGRYTAMLDERTRLARELHDTLLQGFTGITLQLQALHRRLGGAPEDADALARVLSVADVTLRDARLMVWDMRAPELEKQDLVEALESAARTAIGTEPVDLCFTHQGERRRLSLLVETAVLRIGREAVTNAVKHASPSVVAVDLAYLKDSIRVTVTDDGRGITPEVLAGATAGGHWGLHGMRERAQQAGGALTIATPDAGGTVLSVSLPAS